MRRFEAQIGNQSIILHLNELENIHIGEEVIPYSFMKMNDNIFLLRFQNKTYEVFVSDNPDHNNDVQMLTVHINGQRFDVDLEDERQALAKKFGLSNSARETHAQMRAPMPGLITKVEVQEGDQVEEGQGLIVLEAMKMENELKSPRKGSIAKILVREKDIVDKNAVLIELA